MLCLDYCILCTVLLADALVFKETRKGKRATDAKILWNALLSPCELISENGKPLENQGRKVCLLGQLFRIRRQLEEIFKARRAQGLRILC